MTAEVPQGCARCGVLFETAEQATEHARTRQAAKKAPTPKPQGRALR